MANRAGLKDILEAEKEGERTNQKALEYREKRERDARIESERDFEEMKAANVVALEKLRNQIQGSRADGAGPETKAFIAKATADSQAAFQKNKHIVKEKLLEWVVTVQPHIHQNHRRDLDAAIREAHRVAQNH